MSQADMLLTRCAGQKCLQWAARRFAAAKVESTPFQTGRCILALQNNLVVGKRGLSLCAPFTGTQPSNRLRCQSGAETVLVEQQAFEEHCRSFSSDGASSSSEGDDAADVRVAVGSIHLIMGPMFAGKTTALLARMQESVAAGKKVALVKSGIDVRYGLTDVVSHDGTRMPCLAVNTLAEFRETIGDEKYDQLDVIGVDEAQFFTDLDSFCRHAADRDHKEVVVAGLDGDFKRRKFGQLLDLVPTADSIVKLSATCELCRQPASFTLRTTEETETQVVGGADKYMPVCRKHWVEGNYAIKVARTFLQRRTVADEQLAVSSETKRS